MRVSGGDYESIVMMGALFDLLGISPGTFKAEQSTDAQKLKQPIWLNDPIKLYTSRWAASNKPDNQIVWWFNRRWMHPKHDLIII